MNDWHAGSVALLLEKEYKKKDPFYQDIKTVLTIHNLEYFRAILTKKYWIYLDFPVNCSCLKG